jgi:hypothetical protein
VEQCTLREATTAVARSEVVGKSASLPALPVCRVHYSAHKCTIRDNSLLEKKNFPGKYMIYLYEQMLTLYFIYFVIKR